MHKQALDVAIRVVKVRYIGHESVTLIVNVINLGYVGEPKVIMTDKKYTVSSKEYGNYRLLNEIDLAIVRGKPGLPRG